MPMRIETNRKVLKRVIITFEQDYLEFRFAELLLNLDDEWRTPAELSKHTKYLRDAPSYDVVSVLKLLIDLGLVEVKVQSQKKKFYRRTHSMPKHRGIDLR